MRDQRDLFEDRGGSYPAHIRIADFRYEGTRLAASLWIGNENSESEVDVLLTDADVEWIIAALQHALAVSRGTAEGGARAELGYGDGYRAGVRDAQIELRDAIADLDGARRMTIHGYDDGE